MLSTLGKKRTLELTTTGRRSGVPRTARIWFVVDGKRVCVQAGPKGKRGWLANLRANPKVTLAIGGHRFTGVATPVTDPAERERVLGLIRDKYWLARAAAGVGSRSGHGEPVWIEL